MARKSCLMYFVVGCACFSWQHDFTFYQDENLLLDQDKNRLQGAQEWSAQRNLQVTPLTRQKVWSNYSDSDKQAKRKDLDVSSWLKDDKSGLFLCLFFLDSHLDLSLFDAPAQSHTVSSSFQLFWVVNRYLLHYLSVKVKVLWVTCRRTDLQWNNHRNNRNRIEFTGTS